MGPLEEKHMRTCNVRLDDGRHISAEQRKKAYATINDIAAFTGEMPEVMKEWLKYLHIYRTGCEVLSLSSCSMDTARGIYQHDTGLCAGSWSTAIRFRA